jgi:hypothetical protein
MGTCGGALHLLCIRVAHRLSSRVMCSVTVRCEVRGPAVPRLGRSAGTVFPEGWRPLH